MTGEPVATFFLRSKRFAEPLVSVPCLQLLSTLNDVSPNLLKPISPLSLIRSLFTLDIPDRFLPDKAIDVSSKDTSRRSLTTTDLFSRLVFLQLVDEAASALRIAQESKPPELEALNREIVTLEVSREREPFASSSRTDSHSFVDPCRLSENP